MGFVDKEQFRRLFFKLDIEFRPRQIDAVFDCLNGSELYDDLQPNWIPVSKRLPEDMKWVLCYCRGDQYLILRLHGDEWYEDVHGLRSQNSYCRAYMKAFVIAWMPLPQPYERKEE